MQAVSKEVRQLQPLFFFQPKLAGSAREGTRPFRQDKFDYLLLCEIIQAFLDIHISELSAMHVAIKVKQNCVALKEFTTNSGDFDVNKFKSAMDMYFKAAVLRVVKQGCFTELFYVDPKFYESKTISCLHVKWRGKAKGHEHKNLI